MKQTKTKSKKAKQQFKLLTPEFRVSYPNVFEPKAFKPGQQAYYSIEMLFPKDKVKLAELKDLMVECATAKWGPEENWPKPFSKPYFNGDKPNPNNGEMKKEHKGHWVFKASSSAEFSKPHVVGLDPDEVLTPNEFYPGCYARAQIMAHAYENGKNKGVKFILDGVQKTRDGDALGGKKPANQMFSKLEVEDGDDGDFDVDSEDEENDDSSED